jgi:hypothetical protein
MFSKLELHHQPDNTVRKHEHTTLTKTKRHHELMNVLLARKPRYQLKPRLSFDFIRKTDFVITDITPGIVCKSHSTIR